MQTTNKSLIPITQKLCEQADATPQDCTPVDCGGDICEDLCDDDGVNFVDIAVLAAFVGFIALFLWAIYALGGLPALICMIVFPLVSGAFASTSRSSRLSSGSESKPPVGRNH